MTLNLKSEKAGRQFERGYVERLPADVPEMWLGLEGQHRARYRFARDWVRGQQVLDAACGSGYGSAMLYKAGAASVTGVDIAPEAIEEARSHYAAPKLNYRIADLTNLPFEDESFDVIVSFETIEHVADYHKVMSEFYRVLRPGGTLVISTPNPLILSPDMETPSNPYHVKEFNPDEFDALIAEHFPRPFKIYGQFVKHQVPNDESTFVPGITEALSNPQNVPQNDLYRKTRKAVGNVLPFPVKDKLYYLLNSRHLYTAEEDFVFINRQLDKAPFLVAVCHK